MNIPLGSVARPALIVLLGVTLTLCAAFLLPASREGQGIGPVYRSANVTSLSTLPGGIFREVLTDIPNLCAGTAFWVDVDNDNDLDAIAAGWDGAGYVIALFENAGGRLIARHTPFPPLLVEHCLAAGDYDGDGDADIFLSGADPATGHCEARLYRNEHGTFTDTGEPFDGLQGGPAVWFDADGDRDLDLLFGGSPDQGQSLSTRLYRNDHGRLTLDPSTELPPRWASSASVGDVDGDGDADLFLMGYNGAIATAALLRNEAGRFVDAGIEFVGAQNGACAMVDYDVDGDLDLAYNGITPEGATTRLYRNDGAGRFEHVFQAWAAVDVSAMTWADIDGDGDPDLVESGRLIGAPGDVATLLYRNDRTAFTEVEAGLPGTWLGSLSGGDFDGDGRVDLLLTGATSYHSLATSLSDAPLHQISRLFRNVRAPLPQR